jgi:hypothetical protein
MAHIGGQSEHMAPDVVAAIGTGFQGTQGKGMTSNRSAKSKYTLCVLTVSEM